MKKTVLITGTSTGIGRSAALYFAEKGWNVAATMRSPEKENDLQKNPNIKVFALDVTSNASIEQAISSAVTAFGSIDVLVNNAGYGVDGVFEAMSDEVIHKQFDTNVFGLMRMTRAFVSYFRENKIKGNIIQIASVGGQVAFPLYSIYHGTKWAVEGFTESLSFELDPLGIKVKLVEPGAIKTEFYSGSRVFVKPEHTDVYDNFVSTCESVAMDAGSKGADPIEVAKTIFKAANDRSNKLRFAIGYPANFLLPLRNIIPGTWFRFIVKKSYKL
jgi:NAD(P)-dependent dehydrogenase (short-subunit alcohol dehydrogenase family)